MKNIYLLEFHPSLGLASCIPSALEHLLREARHTCRPTSASALTLLERRVLQLALDVWLTPAKPESWYSAQLQKDVGSLKGLGGSLAKRMFPPRCYYLALFLFGSIPLLFGQRSIIVLGLANIFMGFFVHFGPCFQFIGVLLQLSFKGKCTQVGGKYFLVCYSLTIYIF